MKINQNIIPELDLHGEDVEGAKRHLCLWLTRLPKDVKEVRIIHGYNNGTAIKNMIQFKFKHPRVKSKLLSLNPGETRLILK